MTQPPGPDPQYPPPAYQPGYPPPGYGYGYGYPGYAPAGPPSEKPSSNIGWAIAAILTFWPLAIPAFIYSSRVDNAWNSGDRAGAESASRTARTFGIVAVVIGAVMFVLMIVWIVVLAAVFSQVVDVNNVVVTPGP